MAAISAANIVNLSASEYLIDGDTEGNGMNGRKRSSKIIYCYSTNTEFSES